MAKIKYSALVSDMRNKLNGSVMSKNRYGSYVRNKVTPVNPQTQYQQASRMRLGVLSQAWAGIGNSARLAWSELAKTKPFVDIFGDSKTLDGKAFFVKLNSNMLELGSPLNSNAPVLGGIPDIQVIGSSAAVDGTITITISEDTVPAGFALKVFATPALPGQINFVKNRYRDIGFAPAAVGGDIQLGALWSARFGAIGDVDEGKRIFIKAVVVETTTGQQGVPTERIADIDAA